MILVVGATGLLGTRICERLRADGQPVRALIRRTSNPGKVQALRSLGCELTIGEARNVAKYCAKANACRSLRSFAREIASDMVTWQEAIPRICHSDKAFMHRLTTVGDITSSTTDRARPERQISTAPVAYCCASSKLPE